MSPTPAVTTVAERYDRALRYSRGELPPGAPRPAPTNQWPPENVQLLENYVNWLLGGGTSEFSTNSIYLPMAGHILGLNLIPHRQINLENDLQIALDYAAARGLSQDRLKAFRNGLDKFKRFLRLERGLGEPVRTTPFDVPAQTSGLPAWLVAELEHSLRLQQRNWREARLEENIQRFWSGHLRIWRFFCLEKGLQEIGQLKRAHILAYVDARLASNHAVSGVNGDLRILHSFLLFLQEQGYPIPQSLLRIPSLQEPDRLPKYLPDDQVKALREEIERGAQVAERPFERRLALLTRAAFYLLWQGGLRLGEVEELRLEDLELSAKRLTVRDGKNKKDRTIYLTQTAVHALQTYLAVRGPANTDHIFLYRNAPLRKDIIRAQLSYAGERVGVKVHPHRLRHTCATQLLNAGCRVTSIQRFLGHKKLNTTMIYARAHDQTVADDYFAAMKRVEERLDISSGEPEPQPEAEPALAPAARSQLIFWLERLSLPELCQSERLQIAENLKQTLSLHQPSLSG